MSMNPELKAKWLAALRSGEYKQAKSVLNTGDSFCCLGVLCDISGMGRWVRDDRNRAFIYYEYGEAYREFAELPIPLQKGAGIEVVEEAALIQMNDDEDKTFTEIADWIETNL